MMGEITNNTRPQCSTAINNTVMTDAENIGNITTSFIGGFITHIIIGFALLFCRAMFKQKKTLNSCHKSNDSQSDGQTPELPLKKRQLYRTLSFNTPFKSIQDVSTFSIRQLQKLTENEEHIEVENPIDYGPGGYMPCYIGQLIGSDQQYAIIRKLGWGHFSTVWLCENVKRKNNYYAIKIVKASAAFKNVALDEIQLLKCIREKDSTHVGYNKVILLQEYFTEMSIHGGHVSLVFELMGPSLLDLIIQSNYKGIEEAGAKSIIRQILQGLVYLHQVCHIIHTDIKPENILIKVKESYIRNMVDHVNRFRELGVQMPKSYVSAIGWAEHVEMYGQSSSSTTSAVPGKRVRVMSCPKSGFVDVAKDTDYNSCVKHNRLHPMFVDPNIQVKIADLGNSCWEHKHYAPIIQTVQYRALEVILEGDYSFPADMWSVACVAFELCTGEYLFNPHEAKSLSLSEDHLGLIWEVLDGIPNYIAMAGRKSNQFFDREGGLRKIAKATLKIWKVEDVLVEKYEWKRMRAIMFADFIQALIEPDPDLRASASDALTKKWLTDL